MTWTYTRMYKCRCTGSYIYTYVCGDIFRVPVWSILILTLWYRLSSLHRWGIRDTERLIFPKITQPVNIGIRIQCWEVWTFLFLISLADCSDNASAGNTAQSVSINLQSCEANEPWRWCRATLGLLLPLLHEHLISYEDRAHTKCFLYHRKFLLKMLKISAL